MAEIVVETWIGAGAERCFDLARSIDLHVAEQERSGEQAIAGRTSGLIELGEAVTWSARHFLIRWRMTNKVVVFERPALFRDVSISGPFARFEHDHIFRPERGGTLMVDRLVFASPLGPLGRIADALFVKGHLTRLLASRGAAIKTCAETALGDRFVPVSPSRP